MLYHWFHLDHSCALESNKANDMTMEHMEHGFFVDDLPSGKLA